MFNITEFIDKDQSEKCIIYGCAAYSEKDIANITMAEYSRLVLLLDFKEHNYAEFLDDLINYDKITITGLKRRELKDGKDSFYIYFEDESFLVLYLEE